MSQAALLADEFTHKNVFVFACTEIYLSGLTSQTQSSRPKTRSQTPTNDCKCFYCHKQGHVIVDCLALKCKQQQQPTSIGFVSSVHTLQNDDHDDSFVPFLMKGLISITGEPHGQKEVRILHDTGTVQSSTISVVLLLSEKSYCGVSMLVQGFEMGIVSVPLHLIHLQCDLVTGFVKVHPSLPVRGVTLILRIELAEKKFMPILEVLDRPNVSSAPDILNESYPELFPVCAVTQTQLRSVGDETALSDSFMAPVFANQIPCPPSAFVLQSKA